MKKLSILFSLVFFAFVISASAQTSTTAADKEKAATEKVKSDDGTKAKAGCCAYSTKSCKAGSAKCCSMDKSEAKKSDSSSKTEAVATEKKAVAATGTK